MIARSIIGLVAGREESDCGRYTPCASFTPSPVTFESAVGGRTEKSACSKLMTEVLVVNRGASTPWGGEHSDDMVKDE